jgi:hypothetical protein
LIAVGILLQYVRNIYSSEVSLSAPTRESAEE